MKPNLGMNTVSHVQTTPADALFPKVRQRVLAVLFVSPDRSFYANEIIALAQSGTGAVQRELASLVDAGLVSVRKQGNQRHYQADASAPMFAELRGLVLKTMGLADVLRTALAPIAGPVIAISFSRSCRTPWALAPTFGACWTFATTGAIWANTRGYWRSMTDC